MILTTPGWTQDKESPSPLLSPGTQVQPFSNPLSNKESHSRKVNHLPRFFVAFSEDQKHIWTSPSRIRLADAAWLVPLGGVTAGLFATDQGYSNALPRDPTTIRHYNNISNVALGSLMGAGAGMYLLSLPTHNEHWRETGWLSAEAVLNSLVVTETVKYSLSRERPYQGNGSGSFFRGGTSFPSEHAAAAWSAAGVIAHEYPGVFPKLLAYGAAAAVDYSRVHARQHFPSDVLVGSVLGYLVAESVYHRRHEPEIGGRAWVPPSEFIGEEGTHSPANMGSPYVPLDNWVYPVFDRLIALGYVRSAFLGIRPWTRAECVRLLQEAQEHGNDVAETRDVPSMLEALEEEFSPDLAVLDGSVRAAVRLDSIYTRTSLISGSPLTDGFHFAQTLVNDYGRPYATGLNNISGLTAHATAGSLSFDIRAEYQHSPALPSDAPNVLQATAQADNVQPLANGRNEVNRVRLLSGTVGFAYRNVQVSVGKQSLWLGPGSGGPFLYSNNAEPILMARMNQVSPTYVPGLSRLLGPMRTEFAFGRLNGAHWIYALGHLYGPNISNQPFIHLEKVSFKPTANFEFGMGLSFVFGGPQLPVTFGNFFKTFETNAVPGASSDAGDRRSTADFSYRIPRLRDWATLYADSFVDDEVSPLGSNRPAIRAGLFLPKLPHANKMSLRAESVYTDAPNTAVLANLYDNGRYRSGYTNFGQILGSWIGRAGKGGQAWATYSFSPRSTLQLSYRRQVVSQQFLGGGGLNSLGMQGSLYVRSSFSLQGSLQYDSWKFPLLAPGPQSTVTAAFQITFTPKWSLSR